ncbi:MAG: GAF domain-containing sensor histidine kinase [Breznakibacter sp.]
MKLYNNHSQNIRELSIITKISQDIIKTLDYQEVLQAISNGMTELLEIETAAIYILESETILFLGAATPPLDPEMPDSFRRANLSDHPHIATSILTQKPLFISDTLAQKLSPAEKEIIELSKLRSLLYFPFIREKKVIGVLILGTSQKSKNYTKGQIELGQTIANQLSVAIQNSQLHNCLRKHNSNLERLVAERTHELEAANEEYKAINEELNTINEELSKKNEIVIQQKIEIELALKNLKATHCQLIQSEKMASLGVLTAGVAHEINNPLNFIMGGYNGLINELETLDFEKDIRISVFLEAIKTGIDRASGIVKSLNQFSRDNDNYNETCEIHSIIDDCLTILNYQYKNRIEIVRNYENEHLFTIGNTGKLHQVFINIISNAIDSIENNGVIYIETTSGDENHEVSIRDTGCGIHPDNLEKIVDPFFTTKAPGKGTGLGLSISNTIIQQHNGGLYFDSIQNNGTKVLINLPKATPNE